MTKKDIKADSGTVRVLNISEIESILNDFVKCLPKTIISGDGGGGSSSSRIWKKKVIRKLKTVPFPKKWRKCPKISYNELLLSPPRKKEKIKIEILKRLEKALPEAYKRKVMKSAIWWYVNGTSENRMRFLLSKELEGKDVRKIEKIWRSLVMGFKDFDQYKRPNDESDWFEGILTSPDVKLFFKSMLLREMDHIYKKIKLNKVGEPNTGKEDWLHFPNLTGNLELGTIQAGTKPAIKFCKKMKIKEIPREKGKLSAITYEMIKQSVSP